MNLILKSSLSQKKTLLILSLLCLLIGAFAILLGDFVVPGAVAMLALIFLFDTPKGTFGIITSALLIVLNVAALVLGLSVSLFGPESVILAFLLSFAFKRRKEKSGTALIMTVIATLFVAISAVLIPFAEGEAKNFSDVVAFYEAFIEQFRIMFVDAAIDVYKPLLDNGGVQFDESIFNAVYNQQMSLVISYAVIICFALVGLSMKIFEVVYSRIAEDKNPAIYWRFMTNNVFAYFYIALLALSIFTSASAGALGIAVRNLYNIFMVVYAYVGFNYLLALLAIRLRPITALIVLIFAALLAMSLTVQIMAAFGVLFTIRKNRESIIKEE